MHYERYATQRDEQAESFEFISVGKRRIVKAVFYSKTNLEGVYNLGFGDKDPVTGFVTDECISNNGDTDQVLATVAGTVFLFIEKHPDAWVYAQGRTETHTRLYQMGISKNLEEIAGEFVVLGRREKWEPFERGKNYEAFLVRKK